MKTHTYYLISMSNHLSFQTVLLALSLSIKLVSPVAPNLTPDNVQTCLGQKATLTCIVTQGTSIRWEINFVDLSISDVQKAFLESDQPGEILNVTNNRNHIFTFMLISRLPLMSTVTTNVVHDLEGASVSCEDLRTAEVDVSLIHIIDESSTNVSAMSSLIYKEIMEDSMLISVEWHPNSNASVIPGIFFVSINPPIEMGSSFNTTYTSIQLIVLYNQEYNISVMANNCAGNRSLVFVDLLFSIGHCNVPHTNPNVSVEGYDNGLENSQIRYYCQPGFVPNEEMTANCSSGGYWIPDPAALVCKAKCTTPALGRYVEIDLASYSGNMFEGSRISFRCTEGFIPNLTVVSVCTSEAKWAPDPLMHHCEPFNSQDVDILRSTNSQSSITSLISTGVVCSIIVMLIIGFLGGFATKMIIEKRARCAVSTLSTSNTQAETGSLYETIQMERKSQNQDFQFDKNQAYGPLSTT